MKGAWEPTTETDKTTKTVTRDGPERDILKRMYPQLLRWEEAVRGHMPAVIPSKL